MLLHMIEVLRINDSNFDFPHLLLQSNNYAKTPATKSNTGLQGNKGANFKRSWCKANVEEIMINQICEFQPSKNWDWTSNCNNLCPQNKGFTLAYYMTIWMQGSTTQQFFITRSCHHRVPRDSLTLQTFSFCPRWEGSLWNFDRKLFPMRQPPHECGRP